MCDYVICTVVLTPPVSPRSSAVSPFKQRIKDVFLCAENEETEGSEGQADYLFGDAELDDDDLYSMEHDNQAGWSTHPRKKHQNVNIDCEMCFWSAQYFMS